MSGSRRSDVPRWRPLRDVLSTCGNARSGAQGHQITDTVKVTSSVTDPDLSDNQATASTYVK
jgi:hypothetical protein